MLSKESEGCQILIALEGPDYTGKSSLAELLVRQINIDYKHLSDIPAVKVSRPGGTMECANLRRIITNTKLSNGIVRQSFALAEEVLFTNTFKTESQIVIFDRYNPISGQIYGPVEMIKPWQEAVVHNLTFKMDKTIFIKSSIENLLSRAATRSDKCDLMDELFKNKMDDVLTKYDNISLLPRTVEYCNPNLLVNDDFDKLFKEAYDIVKTVIDNKF